MPLGLTKVIIDLVNYGLGNSESCIIPDHTDWVQAMTLAALHGVDAIALDGIQRCHSNHIPIDIDIDRKLEWIGNTHLQEAAYQSQEEAISSLARFYQKHGIRMMVLKGWGLSLNYPNPSHRPCSDLDIYLFGEQERGDKLLESELGIKADNEHHHHSVFIYHGLMVENHYDFMNVHSHRSTRKIENLLKSMAQNAVPVKTKDGTDVWLPSPDFNALFVLRHMAAHFAAVGMNLRMILDWGLLMNKHHQEIDWDRILPIIRDINMHKYLDAVNYICYTYLGFDKDIFVGFGDESFGERVFADLFDPDNFKPKKSGLIAYPCDRLTKWWHNRWKHQIVYSDSLLSTFFYQVHAHLMKPASLVHRG